ncbi:MAG: hypothetical protein ABEK50_01215 [bacterium]
MESFSDVSFEQLNSDEDLRRYRMEAQLRRKIFGLLDEETRQQLRKQLASGDWLVDLLPELIQNFLNDESFEEISADYFQSSFNLN